MLTSGAVSSFEQCCTILDEYLSMPVDGLGFKLFIIVLTPLWHLSELMLELLGILLLVDLLFLYCPCKTVCLAIGFYRLFWKNMCSDINAASLIVVSLNLMFICGAFSCFAILPLLTTFHRTLNLLSASPMYFFDVDNCLRYSTHL